MEDEILWIPCCWIYWVEEWVRMFFLFGRVLAGGTRPVDAAAVLCLDLGIFKLRVLASDID